MTTLLIKSIRFLIYLFISFYLIGELYFRAPFSPKLLQYDFDPVLHHKIAPSQFASMGLANFSYLSPPLTISDEGFRNISIDWSNKFILSLGSSEVLGPGVEDTEIWTYQLENLLNQNSGKDKYSVINGGCGGYGSYHVNKVIERFLKYYGKPELIIIRVSIGDRNFIRPNQLSLDRSKRNKRISDGIKRYSKFAQFFLNRLEAQLRAVLNIFNYKRDTGVHSFSYEKTDAALSMMENHREYYQNIVILAEKYHMPILFFIDNSYNAESGNKLYDLFIDDFGYLNDLVYIVMANNDLFGLTSNNIEERRLEFVKNYTLPGDPHSNEKFHKIIANFLFRKVQKLLNTNIKIH